MNFRHLHWLRLCYHKIILTDCIDCTQSGQSSLPSSQHTQSVDDRVQTNEQHDQSLRGIFRELSRDAITCSSFLKMVTIGKNIRGFENTKKSQPLFKLETKNVIESSNGFC